MVPSLTLTLVSRTQLVPIYTDFFNCATWNIWYDRTKLYERDSIPGKGKGFFL
jgi:hypothetical protein